jgi:hypothetical protein
MFHKIQNRVHEWQYNYAIHKISLDQYLKQNEKYSAPTKFLFNLAGVIQSPFHTS